jgi:glycosyltransferase involved in cell wall biosynthesis
LDITLTPGAADLLKAVKRRGVTVGFVIYDLLPLSNPEWFDAGTVGAFRNWLALVISTADYVLCISQSTARAFSDQIAVARTVRHPTIVKSFYLGSDLDGAAPVAPCVRETPQGSNVSPIFLQVGTVEPRKGHAQVIDAFEYLWSAGTQFHLMMVGRPGWKMDSLLERLRNHAERGKRFTWLENASDQELHAAYANATAALVASFGEGFGLPIVEAARYKIYVIARNLDVFREVANDGAFYFDAHSGEQLAQALLQWHDRYRAGLAPSPSAISAWTWRESAKELLHKIQSIVVELNSRSAPG